MVGLDAYGEGSPIPSQIAAVLAGRKFATFKKFREALWTAIANDSTLTEQFTEQNVQLMKKGLAPFSQGKEHVGKNGKYEIHHIDEVANGGAVYDIDNLRIVTPREHIRIHSRKKT